MAVVACVLLLLSCSIAGRATPTPSLATGWQEGDIGEKAAAEMTWLYEDRNKTPPVARASGIGGTDGLDEVLIKRTSGSPWHRPGLAHKQGTGLQPVPPTIPPGAPPAPHVLRADNTRWPALSSATPSQISAVGPSAPHTEPESSTKQPDKAFKRHPYGSLRNNPALRAQAKREYRARLIEKIKKGERINRTKPGGGKYTVTTFDDYQASRTAQSKRAWSNLTEEGKAKTYERRNKDGRRVRAKRRAQRKAQLEGRSWEGSPVRKPGRPRRNWEQEQAAAEEDVHQHEPANARMEEATQRVVDVPNASPTTVWPRPPEPSSGSWPVLESLPRASHHQFARVSSSPPLDLHLSLSAPGSSTSGQRPTQAPRQSAPPPAKTLQEQRLRLTLAPPGEHDPSGEIDRLRLTFAPPRHD